MIFIDEKINIDMQKETLNSWVNTSDAGFLLFICLDLRDGAKINLPTITQYFVSNKMTLIGA